jgi:NAD(P)-dependent dehydrogenase (short-subunit alcohol dehydrogenase family)
MDVPGRSVLVVGGASGLGEAVVTKLHGQHARVLIADLNEEAGTRLAAALDQRFAAVDVTDERQVEQVVARAAAHTGGLAATVCCAGIGWGEKTTGKRGPHTLESFRRVLDVNLIGTFNVLRHSATAMAANEPGDSGERGVIINTASVAAFEGQIGQLAYSASKGAIVAMTLPAARDLAPLGIRVCTVAPGTFATPLMDTLTPEQQEALARSIPFPSRLGRPSEFAELAAQLISNQMINGEVVRIDGAIRMGPR